MNIPTLGVHLIIHNEAALLPQCLESLAGAADEIIIVDTGSTDNSAAIAESYGAKVYPMQWSHDFSAARNTGLSYAQTDWVLILDADEILKTPLGNIAGMLRNTEAMAFTVNIENWLGSAPEERLTHSAIRLFRNGKGYRFHGIIHEGVDASVIGKHGASVIRSSGIEIIHLGYLPGIMAQKDKVRRNEQLLRRALAEEPENVFYSYNLAVTCCQSGQLEEAAELLSHTISRAPLQVSYRPSMIRDLCKIQLSLNNMKAVDALLARELQRYGDYSDLHFIQGQSWESQGLPERAFQSYQRAAAGSEDRVGSRSASSEKYVSEKGMDSFRPLHRMGEISLKLGHAEEAARWFHRALQHHSLYAPALQGIASAFQRLDVPDQRIAALLIQLAGTEQAAGRSAVIRALEAVCAYEAIAELPAAGFPLERETLPAIISAWVITGRLHEARNALLEAYPLLKEAAGMGDEMRRLWMIAAVCRWKQEDPLQAEAFKFTDAPEPLLSALLLIGERLTHRRHKSASPMPSDNSDHSMVVTELIRQAVELRSYGLAAEVAEVMPGHRSDLAEALYEAGQLEAAGELLIALATEKQARGKVSFYLAEMLFDKGHYEEAALWFRQMLAEASGDEPARIGLSLCYLHLARQELAGAEASFPEIYTHGPLQEDITDVNQAIAVLNRTAWHTQWSFYQTTRKGAAS
ncbi:glycosyltransferase family 2 protein [Paenibacillus sp. S150]|uniref:tetratricopeptide repeat-containing glycosyltransferase family 2 protein n=1 Tax=Paenibacillus sp. S150 TaxID=2749826 RepID=UPI001C57361F|nr:glycosyltransferase family 2 protein [Paenibacillus sp. S150]MBW4085586.1 glycosyltransferase [Paenibacillus sp. S150]